jgi:hypothetical protein
MSDEADKIFAAILAASQVSASGDLSTKRYADAYRAMLTEIVGPPPPPMKISPEVMERTKNMPKRRTHP